MVESDDSRACWQRATMRKGVYAADRRGGGCRRRFSLYAPAPTHVRVAPEATSACVPSLLPAHSLLTAQSLSPCRRRCLPSPCRWWRPPPPPHSPSVPSSPCRCPPPMSSATIWLNHPGTPLSLTLSPHPSAARGILISKPLKVVKYIEDNLLRDTLSFTSYWVTFY